MHWRVFDTSALSVTCALPEPQIKCGIAACWVCCSSSTSTVAVLLQVGFPRRNTDKLRRALNCTHTTLWIRCNRSSRWAKQGQMLGFARADSDGTLTATIWDVAVAPAWQRIGLGRGLVERVVRSLMQADVDCITLYAEPGVVLLYEKLGFCKDVQELKGMAFQKTTQEGRAFIAASATPAPAAA